MILLYFCIVLFGKINQKLFIRLINRVTTWERNPSFRVGDYLNMRSKYDIPNCFESQETRHITNSLWDMTIHFFLPLTFTCDLQRLYKVTYTLIVRCTLCRIKYEVCRFNRIWNTDNCLTKTQMSSQRRHHHSIFMKFKCKSTKGKFYLHTKAHFDWP